MRNEVSQVKSSHHADIISFSNIEVAENILEKQVWQICPSWILIAINIIDGVLNFNVDVAGCGKINYYYQNGSNMITLAKILS